MIPGSNSQNSLVNMELLNTLPELDIFHNIFPSKGVGNRPYIIGLSGASGSGKGHVADMLMSIFGEENISVLSFDWFYRSIKHLTMEERKQHMDGAYNFDSVYCVDHEYLLDTIDKYAENFQNSKEPSALDVPVYCFKTHLKQDGKFNKLAVRPILLVDGIHVFSYKKLLNCLDLKLHLVVHLSEAFHRRFETRDDRERTADSIIAQWLNSVHNAMESVVSLGVIAADYLIPWFAYDSGIIYELALLITRDLLLMYHNEDASKLFSIPGEQTVITTNLFENITLTRNTSDFMSWHKKALMVIAGYNTYLEIPESIYKADQSNIRPARRFEPIYNMALNACLGKLNDKSYDYMFQHSSIIGKTLLFKFHKENYPFKILNIQDIGAREAGYEPLFEYRDILSVLYLSQKPTVLHSYFNVAEGDPQSHDLTNFVINRLYELVCNVSAIENYKFTNMTRCSNLCISNYVEYTDYNMIDTTDLVQYSGYVCDKELLFPFSDTVKNLPHSFGGDYLWTDERISKFIPVTSDIYHKASNLRLL